jgi:hypothetical protein
MSDIYLQITETPTVVTLSAPVISGALSSTVTVANTVTVALDANSLSALENVTVTVGAAVSISNFPITQSVSLASVPTHAVTLASTTVTVSSLPAISGTVTANGGDFSAIVGESMPSKAVAIGFYSGDDAGISQVNDSNKKLPISGTVTIGSALPAGTNRIGVVTIGGGTVTIGAGTAQIGSVTASISGTVPVSGTFYQATQPVSGTFWQATQPVSLASVPAHAVTLTSTTVTVSSLPALAAGTAQIGSVTASIFGTVPVSGTFFQATQPASLASLPALAAGTNQIGSVTASISGTVPVSGTFWQTTQPVSLTSTTVTVNSLPSLAAGTNQIGSVTASISGTVPISISSVTVGNSVTIGSLPALAAGTAQIGSVTASISNTAVTVCPAQGTIVTNSNFTSTTASTTLVSAVAGRDVLTVFNEGAGNLFISPGATATTIAYQVRLSAGDYWECPEGQLSLAHAAVFATAGTARVTEVS